METLNMQIDAIADMRRQPPLVVLATLINNLRKIDIAGA